MKPEQAKWLAIGEIKSNHGGNKAMMAGVFTAHDGGTVSCNCHNYNHGNGWHGPTAPHHPNCVIEDLQLGADLYECYL